MRLLWYLLILRSPCSQGQQLGRRQTRDPVCTRDQHSQYGDKGFEQLDNGEFKVPEQRSAGTLARPMDSSLALAQRVDAVHQPCCCCVRERCFWKLPASYHPILDTAPLHLGHALLKDGKIAPISNHASRPRCSIALHAPRSPSFGRLACLAASRGPSSHRSSATPIPLLRRSITTVCHALMAACHLASYAIFLAADWSGEGGDGSGRQSPPGARAA
jgi:hypothetical protein